MPVAFGRRVYCCIATRRILGQTDPKSSEIVALRQKNWMDCAIYLVIMG
jgi:hypothetical protein